MKYLYDVVTNIITTIELFESKKMADVKEYVKFHGQAEYTTTRHCKTAGVYGMNNIVTIYYWFANIHCPELIRESFALNDLGMPNTYKSVTPMHSMTKL